MVPNGELRVADGISIGVSINGMFPEEFVAVDFPITDNERHATVLDIVMIRTAGRFENPAGIRADIPGTVVARWDDWEVAYGTDGGLDGLVTQRLIDVAEEEGWDMDTQPVTFDDMDADADHLIADVDGVPGDDYLTFSNGFGDGAFPMARGYDVSGDTVALVVWNPRSPWRLAIPDGTPPATVTLREREFLRCVADPSLVELDGSCPTEL